MNAQQNFTGVRQIVSRSCDGSSFICILIAFFVTLSVAVVAEAAANGPQARTSVDQDSVLTQAVLMRAIAQERPGLLIKELQSFPIGIIDVPHRADPEWRSLWSSFFKGALTKVASPEHKATILYYNPIADVALTVQCRAQEAANRGPRCDRLCAAPGEFLRDQSPLRKPAWQSAADPLHAIRASTTDSIKAFSRHYGTSISEGPSTLSSLCSKNAQAIAELRLFDLIIASKDFDARAYTAAVAAYLAAHLAHPPKPATDAAFDVLARVRGTNFSGALPLGKEGWLVFLTPKTTGWDQALIFLQNAPGGHLTVSAARVVSYGGG